MEEARKEHQSDSISTDKYSKIILDITYDLPRSVSEINKECDIPLSTIYRKIHKLHRNNLLKTIIKITPNGSKYTLYKSKTKLDD